MEPKYPREQRRRPVGSVPSSELSYITLCQAQQIVISVQTKHERETVFQGDSELLSGMLAHKDKLFLINHQERLLETSLRYVPFVGIQDTLAATSVIEELASDKLYVRPE